MAFIYKITNLINNKCYIGKTEFSVEKRFKEHCLDAFRDRNKDRPLYRAMRKYGINNFVVDIIEETENPEEREIYWIEQFKTYRNGYNATMGGDGKKYYNDDIILDHLIFNPNCAEVASDLHCSADTVRAVAKKYSLQSHRCVSENFGDVNNKKMIPVIGYGDGVLCSFDSLADAASWVVETGRTKSKSRSVRSHISECAKGKLKSAYKMKWIFL